MVQLFSGFAVQLVLVQLAVVVLCRGFSASEYAGSVTLDTDYMAYYRVDAAKFYLALQIDAAQQWFGFGISEPTAGDMDGSDIVIVETKAGSTDVTVTDRYALDKSTPLIDFCQDWSLEGSSVNGSILTVELSRDLDTGSNQDRVIPSTGVFAIVWAYGSSSSGSIQYHSSNRGFAAINLDQETAIPSSWSYKDFQISNFSSTTSTTIYACQTFSIRNDAQFHVVRFEVIEDPRRLASSLELHHLIVYACNSGTGYYVNNFASPAVCNSVTGQDNTGCTFPMFTWAKGEKYYDLPSNVGFRVGANSFDKFVIEVHYDNPNNVAGEIDSSIVRAYYTTEFREHDAGVIVVGDPFVLSSNIPAGKDAYDVTTRCIDTCTEKFAKPLNVFGSLLHMHAHGSRMWSTLVSSTGESTTYNRIDFYNWGIQKTSPVEFVLNPGDSVETHCVYDTRSESTSVAFGTSSTQEMCMDFLYYYPYSKTDYVAAHCGRASPYLSNKYGLCDLDVVYSTSALTSSEDTSVTFGLAESSCTGSPSAAVSAEFHPLYFLLVLVGALCLGVGFN